MSLRLVKGRGAIRRRLSGETTDSFLELDQIDTDALKSFAAALKSRADGIDDAEFKLLLAGVVSEKQELSDRMELAKHRTAIVAEIDRLKALGKLNKAKSGVTTAPMTIRVHDLARKYVTDSVKPHFLGECSNLGLEHVVLGDKGGDKGKLRHKPTLSGATPGSTPKLVLSEGEQTARGWLGSSQRSSSTTPSQPLYSMTRSPHLTMVAGRRSHAESSKSRATGR